MSNHVGGAGSGGNRSPGVRRSLSHEIWGPGMRCERPLAHVIPLTHASLKEHEKMWAR